MRLLAPIEREAITVTFYGNCTCREAAVVLGIPESTCKSRIRSGLAALHALMVSDQDG
jgi:DNA-directed RNA polymerase specialized sigma24 family protein